jgi:hypothetical protein
MLFRNLLLVVFLIGMVFSIPVENNKEEKEITDTETIPATKSDKNNVTTFEIDATKETKVVIDDSEGKKGVTETDDVKEEKKDE